MNYHNITHDDMSNGDGLRVVLWLAGCEHHCDGCQNPITWNPDDGLRFDDRAKFEIFKELEKKYVAVVPCADFGMPDYIRLSYATSMELIKKGMDRIEEMVKELK